MNQKTTSKKQIKYVSVNATRIRLSHKLDKLVISCFDDNEDKTHDLFFKPTKKGWEECNSKHKEMTNADIDIDLDAFSDKEINRMGILK